MPARFSVVELRILWHQYHDSVHPPMHTEPCDADPGEKCHAEAFSDWLAKRQSQRPVNRLDDCAVE